MSYILLQGVTNPDSSSISNKAEVNITVSAFDISASGYFDKINTNYSETEIEVYIPTLDYFNSSSYYVPIYNEELDYQVWLSKINRNFQELD